MEARPSKLTFKRSSKTDEERQERKKRKKSKSTSSQPGGSEDASVEADVPTEGWLPVRAIEHFKGPVVLYHRGTDPITSLFSMPESEVVTMKAVSPDDNVQTLQPTQVNQVFIAQKLVGSSSGSDAWGLKSSEGKFLGCDKFGVVTCGREAVGPTEEWIPTVLDDGVALQSIYGKYLKVDQPTEKQTAHQLRCDSDEIGFCETFLVKCQAQVVALAQQQRKAQIAEASKASGALKSQLEAAKLYQSWGGGRHKVDKEDVDALRRAQQDGHLSGALLDRRAKVKADRYCK
ncbi:hypothetical protein RI367_006629 [Sorochytrium milnesiophthora]